MGILVVTVLALGLVSSVAGQIPEASPQELQGWLATPQAADRTVGCFIQYQQGQCDPRSRSIGGLLPALARSKFQCRPQCTENSQRAITYIVNTLQRTYPNQWQRLGNALTSGNRGTSGSSGSSGIPNASTGELREWLANPAAAQRTVSCIINFRAFPDCDPRAQALTKVLPTLARNNFQCPEPDCPAGLQQTINLFLNTLRTNYPDQFQRLNQFIRG